MTTKLYDKRDDLTFLSSSKKYSYQAIKQKEQSKLKIQKTRL